MFRADVLENGLSKVVKWGLYAALFTPFIFWQTFMFPFIAVKVFGFHILTEIIFGAWLVFLLLRRERPVLSRVSWAVLALLAVLLITAATGVNFERSFWSTQERAIGIFSLLHFAAFFLILSDFLRRGLVRLDPYLKTAFFVGAGMAAGALLQVYQPEFFLTGDRARAGGFLGNPTYLAGYALFNVFLGLWLVARSASRKARWAFIALTAFQAVVIVVFTQTRGAMVGLGAGLLFLLLALAFFKKDVFSRIARVLLAVLFALALVFWFTRTAPVWQEVPGVGRIASLAESTAEIQPRLLAWKVGWDSFLERPLSGWGFENFKYAMDRGFPSSLFRFGFGETYWDKPHNIFLEYLVAGGVLGLAAFGYLFWAAFRSAWRLPYGVFFAAALAAHLASNAFVFDTFGTYLMLFIVLAAADSKNLRTYDVLRDSSSHSGSMTRHTATKAAVVLLAAAAAGFLIYLNVSVVYANNRHYWGANYFVNDFQEEGLDSFRKALGVKFNPYVNATRRDFGDLATQMYVLGNLPEPEKNLPWAVSELDKAIGEDPDNYYMYLTLADMIVNFYELNPGQLLDIGQAAIDKAIELSPKRQQNYYVKAKLHFILNEDEEAVATMEKAVALDPEIGDPHFYYAFTLLELGDREKGFAELKTAGELGRLPDNAEEARIVANYYGDAQMWEESLFWYKIAVTMEPSDNEARLKLGLVYYMSGNHAFAREAIGQVMEKIDLRTSPAYDLLLPIIQDLGLTPPGG